MDRQKSENYRSTVAALLMHPGTYFGDRFKRITAIQACGFLMISAFFFSTMGTLARPGNASVRMGVILFVNAVGMAGIGAGIAYVALIAVTGKRVGFKHLWNLFSLSACVVLLLAWIPAAFFFTEPWRWWLIGTGMVRGLGVSKSKTAIIILITFGAMVMMVYTVLSMALVHS